MGTFTVTPAMIRMKKMLADFGLIETIRSILLVLPQGSLKDNFIHRITTKYYLKVKQALLSYTLEGINDDIGHDIPPGMDPKPGRGRGNKS